MGPVLNPVTDLEQSSKMDQILQMACSASEATISHKMQPITFSKRPDPQAFYRAQKNLARNILGKTGAESTNFFNDMKYEIEANKLGEEDAVRLMRGASTPWVVQLLDNVKNLPVREIIDIVFQATVPFKNTIQKKIDLEKLQIRKASFMEDTMKYYGHELDARPDLQRDVVEEIVLRKALECIPSSLKHKAHKNVDKNPYLNFYQKVQILNQLLEEHKPATPGSIHQSSAVQMGKTTYQRPIHHNHEKTLAEDYHRLS